MEMYGRIKSRLMRCEASAISLSHTLISRYLVGTQTMENHADILRNDVLNKDKIEDIMIQGIKNRLAKSHIVTYLELRFRHGYIVGQYY